MNDLWLWQQLRPRPDAGETRLALHFARNHAMATFAAYRIFLSAVTRELGSYRAEVARVLRRKGSEVREQEHFHQGHATLLEMLRSYIEQCDAVILLIGERYGAFPNDEHTAALQEIPLFEKYRTVTGQAGASYTQWEYFLAKHFGKKTYVFRTDTGFSPDEPNTEDADFNARQAAYRDWIDASGEHRDPLTTLHRLIEDVLVLPFPDLRTAKPINLPLASLGELFQGREEEVATLRNLLSEGRTGKETAVLGKAISGLGGVGKSRLAIEYAWRFADEYSAVLFVGAGMPSDLRRNLASLSKSEALNLPEGETSDEEVQVSAVLRFLAEEPGWLLILDNVDTEEAAAAVDAFLPRLRGGHVLLTGRLARWGAEVKAIELDVLTEVAAVSFLLARTEGRRRSTKDDAEEAQRLAREVGCLPLALEQAGAYIAEHRLTLNGYSKRWHSRREQVLSWFDPRVNRYPASVAITWKTSFDRLTAPAGRLLERLAWLGPEPIPEFLLEVQIPDLPETAADPDPHGALTDLATYSLVTRSNEKPTFSVHRLVQEVTRRSLRGVPARERLDEALRWVDAAFVGDPQDVRTWSTLDPLSPHARAVVTFADSAGIADPTATLMNDLAQLFDAKALLAEAEPLMRRALAIDEDHFGLEHPNVAIALNNLAQLLQATNRFAEAEPLMRRALAIDEVSFGTQHPEVAIDLNNLAQLLQSTNRFAEAEPLMRRALAIDEGSLEAESSNVARDLSNLAQLLQETNRLAEAEPLMRRALTIDEGYFGTEHPNVARDLNNLAALLQAMDRLGEAELLMRRALAVDEGSLGAEHPEVATDLNNLATLLKAMDRLGEAEPLMQRSLAIVLEFERQTGFEHPNRSVVSSNYRGLLLAMGKAEAEIITALAAVGAPL